MARSYLLKAANDNSLGRTVVVNIPELDDTQMSVLADIFAGLLSESPAAANDNQPTPLKRDRQ